MIEKIYLGSNLKMYKTIAQTQSFLSRLAELTTDINRKEVAIFIVPSYTALDRARQTVSSEQIQLGAQNMHPEEEGQFTGEISPLMLQEIGIDIIEIGHSERRHVMGEKDEEENKKVLSALQHGFKALLCVGETGEQKALDLSDEVLATQLKIGLNGVEIGQLDRLWIAYEPVWAIGVNGVPASAKYADAKHAVIKKVLDGLFGSAAAKIPVLYGGSVNLENCEELSDCQYIDGLFVGRAAWDADRFNHMIRMAIPRFRAKRN
ncbi:MAG: triose-phosphate isomerase [Eubacteriales bacterium]